MKPKPQADDPNEVFEHAWKENRNLYPIDQLLRKHGFRIHSRQLGKMAVWKRGEDFYTEAEALATIPRDEVRKARGEGPTLRGGIGK
jgi:hypothetical protein